MEKKDAVNVLRLIDEQIDFAKSARLTPERIVVHELYATVLNDLLIEKFITSTAKEVEVSVTINGYRNIALEYTSKTSFSGLHGGCALPVQVLVLEGIEMINGAK